MGRLAGERAVSRLGAKTPPTTTASVLFTPRVARGLWGHLIGAISGGTLYRNASFLKDRIDERIAVDHDLAPTWGEGAPEEAHAVLPRAVVEGADG